MGAASSCDCTVTTHIRACFTPCPCPWPRPPALLPTPALVPPPPVPVPVPPPVPVPVPVPVPDPTPTPVPTPARPLPTATPTPAVLPGLFRSPYRLCLYRWTRCQNHQYRRPRPRRSNQCQQPRRGQRCCRCQSRWPYLPCRYRWTRRCQNLAAGAYAGRPSANGRADTGRAAGACSGGRTCSACAGGSSARPSAAAYGPGSMSMSDANGQTVPVTNPNSQAVSMSHADP